MKLPAVAIAAAFACGILLGLWRISPSAKPTLFPALLFATVVVLLILGLALAWRNFVWCSAIVSLFVWAGLGALGDCVAEQPLPPEHILMRFSSHQIPQRTPLRWHGVLRGEPSRLPWGYGLEMSLEGVETAEGYVPVSGGMRVGSTPRESDDSLPELHAGDEISLLSEARLPLVYKDEGAFDRREFLARQDIHALTTLREHAS